MSKAKKKSSGCVLFIIGIFAVLAIIGIMQPASEVSQQGQNISESTATPPPPKPTEQVTVSDDSKSYLPAKDSTPSLPEPSDMSLEALLNDYSIRPREVSLAAPASIAIVSNGQNVGEIELAEGTVVALEGIQEDGTLKLRHNSGRFTANYQDTDIFDRARAQRLANEAEIARKAKEQAQAAADAEKAAYNMGFDDGWIVGKADWYSGRERRGLWAKDNGKRLAQGMEYPTQYAKGYHEGYNEGWHAAKNVTQ